MQMIDGQGLQAEQNSWYSRRSFLGLFGGLMGSSIAAEPEGRGRSAEAPAGAGDSGEGPLLSCQRLQPAALVARRAQQRDSSTALGQTKPVRHFGSSDRY
jgi:hypothetical protein